MYSKKHFCDILLFKNIDCKSETLLRLKIVIQKVPLFAKNRKIWRKIADERA